MNQARRLWEAIEPLHAVVYFHPGPADAMKILGLRGWWMGYFAGRFAPLGAIGPAPAAAMAFSFAPGMVARSLPDAWRYASPEHVVVARLYAATTALRSSLPSGQERAVEELADLLADAVSACRYEGRPLAAGWAGVDPVPRDDPITRLWLDATILREHRGDGHVIAAVAEGLGGLETTLTLVGTGEVAREQLQPNRGWSDGEWGSAERRLVERGVLDSHSRLTETGAELRGTIEELTDRLASAPVDRLGASGVDRVVDLAAPLSRHLVDTGVVPVPNPIGAPRP